MDKQTLSQYGWIIIMVLTLSVMLAFATPFGQYIGRGVSNVAISMGIINDSATKEDNINKLGDEWDDYLNNRDPSLNPNDGTTPKDNDTYDYEDYIYTYLESDGGWEVSVIDAEKTSYKPILESINKKPIVSLKSTFYGCINMIESPKIPETVKNMYGTFENCASLISPPEIPKSVTNMDSTFSYCKSLTSAPKLPPNVTNLRGTFSNCYKLTVAPTIPNKVEDMYATFWRCSTLVTAPTIPSSVKNLNSTFGECTSLVTAPTILNGVTEMVFSFSGCTSLLYAPVLPNSVTNIYGIFQECTSLKESPIIPNKVVSMGYSFNGCKSLASAPVVPSSVENLIGTFQGCTSLTGIVTINSTHIGDFENCLYGTTKPIVLTGTYVKLNELATTANNNNITIQ